MVKVAGLPETARETTELPSAPASWALESGTRPRVQLESLLEDTDEVITTTEPWRQRALRQHSTSPPVQPVPGRLSSPPHKSR